MKQVNREHYSFQKYMNLARWSCYYLQIKEALALEPSNILEVGPGDGLFGEYMKRNDISYTSLDMAEDIDVDIRAQLGEESLPIDDNSFDLVCAFQVLEHIPYDKVPFALRELGRVSKRYVFLDIPQYGFHMQLAFKIPLLRYHQWHIVLPRPKKHIFDGQHYWEIGKKGYSVSKVRALIKKTFVIDREFSIYQNPKERFYLLQKNENI